MNEFKIGQLVAVRDSADSAWHLRVYDHASPEGMHFCRALNRLIAPCWWNEVCSAEVVWPDIFLAGDRVTIEHLQDMRQRLHERTEEIGKALIVANAQIEWLCQELNQINSGSDEMCHCPDLELRFAPKPMDCHPEGCASCWEQASLKATEEADDNQ